MKIKSFDELFIGIKEALDHPISVDWIKTTTNWVGNFSTDNNQYVIIISKQDYGIWKFKYFLKENGRLSVKLTKYRYDVFKVISTIRKSVYDFIDEVNPNGLIFGADNDSYTRVKFYSRFSDECVEKYNYKLYKSSFGSDEVNPTIYVLYYKLDPEELYDIIKKISDDEMGV